MNQQTDHGAEARLAFKPLVRRDVSAAGCLDVLCQERADCLHARWAEDLSRWRYGSLYQFDPADAGARCSSFIAA